MRLAAAERREHVEERHLPFLDGDSDPEVEPVGVAGHLLGRHPYAQRVSGLAVVGGISADLDGHPGLMRQQRQ